MKIKFLLAFAFWLLIFAVSCKNDDITFDNATKELRFSKDTVFCDTVYNQVRSETYAVKVYNQEDKDVMIPRIALKDGARSLYRINVDGKSGTEFSNVPLRKKDSLFIFVEIAPVASAPEAIAEDKIQFQTGTGNQEVTLLSVVQDAEFYIQSDSNPNIINKDMTWDNDKAKIIFGKLTLAPGNTLTVKKGAKVYFTKNSSLLLSENTTLNVNGELGSEVLFRGDRSDTKYDTIPLNWKGIRAEKGAKLNINYAKIFGGETGLQLISAEANINNTIIHTFQNYGIYALASVVNAGNLVMNNCGEADFGIFKGGNINLSHCTLANYWQLNSSLPAYALYATNEYKNESGNVENGALTLNIKNTILYGDKENSVFFKPVSGQSFNYSIANSLLKTGTNAGFTFDGNSAIVNSIKNDDPKFVNHFTQKMNLRLKDDSPAKRKGAYLSQFSTDITGTQRSNPPSVGAYE